MCTCCCRVFVGVDFSLCVSPGSVSDSIFLCNPRVFWKLLHTSVQHQCRVNPPPAVACFVPRGPLPVPALQESSKKEVLRVCSQMDELMEEAKEEAANGNQGPSRRR